MSTLAFIENKFRYALSLLISEYAYFWRLFNFSCPGIVFLSFCVNLHIDLFYFLVFNALQAFPFPVLGCYVLFYVCYSFFFWKKRKNLCSAFLLLIFCNVWNLIFQIRIRIQCLLYITLQSKFRKEKGVLHIFILNFNILSATLRIHTPWKFHA